MTLKGSDVPPLVEHGSTVPITVSVESPMTEADHVVSIHVFNEKNPQPNVGNFYLGPRGGPSADRNAHPPCRYANADCHRKAVGRFPLVGVRRRGRHPRGLHRGGDLMASALINVPAKANRGDVIEIKTLMAHNMERPRRPGAPSSHRRRFPGA